MSTWKNSSINGVIIKELIKNQDSRGFLSEIYRLDELPDYFKPVMSYISFTNPGIFRGPHEHLKQTDMFYFIGPGTFILKLWDNRKNSSTHSNYLEIYAGESNPLSIIVPPGIVHGYKNLSDNERGMVINCPDRLYKGLGKKGIIDEIRYEDDPRSPFKME